MSNRNAHRDRPLTPRQLKLKLAQEFPQSQANIGLPPRQPPRVAMAGCPERPTLTQIFNRAARGVQLNSGHGQIASKRRIELLERQRSQPRHTLEYTPLGSVRSSWNPEKERSISGEIAALKTSLARQQGLSTKFQHAARRTTLSYTFNQAASRGMGM
jgi:hypothetical protein